MPRSYYLLFFFLAIQGCAVLGFLSSCDTPKCLDAALKRELERIGWAPTTELQLNILCPPTLKSMRCLITAMEDCAGKDINELSISDDKDASKFGHYLVTMRYLLTQLCTEGSELRENYLSSVSCIKGLAMGTEIARKCQQKGYEWYSAYELSKALLGNEITGEDRENGYECMVLAYTLGCFAAEVQDTCGEVARKTFVDTLQRFQYLKREECTEANFNALKTEFLDFLEFEELRKSIFSSVFESKKRRK